MSNNRYADIQKYVEKTSTCWNWTGTKDRDGYGRVRWQGKMHGAHRIFYTQEIGEIPKGLVINHMCRNTSCVNPLHLEATTHKHNILTGVSMSAINARRTHCVNGHEFNKENTHIMKVTGYRVCIPCRRARDLVYKHRTN